MRKVSGLFLIVMLALLLVACGPDADRQARKAGTTNEKNEMAIKAAEVTPTPVPTEVQVAQEATAAAETSPVAATGAVASPVGAAGVVASPAATPVASPVASPAAVASPGRG